MKRIRRTAPVEEDEDDEEPVFGEDEESEDIKEEPEIAREEEEPEEEKTEIKDERIPGFNLEDTILAAATAQGIEIPGEEKEEEYQETEKPEKEEDEENVVIEEMILEEQEKSDGFLERKVDREAGENVPDLEMPDLESLMDDEEDIVPVIEKNADDNTEKGQDDDFLAEIIEGENEEDDDDEEVLLKGFIEEEEPPKPEEDMTEEEKIESFISSIQPEDSSDPVDIIPRSKELSEEEKKLFSYFVKVPGMKEQILDALYDVQIEAHDKTSNTGNIIVMGGAESGKTRLISGLIPAICKELNLEASKVAYVFAEQINGKDIDKIVSKLAGGFLVIEQANQLDKETAAALTAAMERDTRGMIFILEDDKIGMRKMIARYPKFAKKFTSTINIPVFTNDELANFAKIYAMENGYRIDNMGMLALYNMISINQKEDKPMNIGAVKQIVDSAIAKSKGGLKMLRKNAMKKRMDAEGFIVLYEKDFIKK